MCFNHLKCYLYNSIKADNSSAIAYQATHLIGFSDTVTNITGIGWTLRLHSRQIPTCQLSHRRVLLTAHTTRKPTLLLLLSRVLLLLRDAERQFCGLLFQEPPRSRVRLSLLYSLNQVREANICCFNCQVSPCSR